MTSWATWREQATAVASGGLEIATYDLGDPGARSMTFLHGYPSSSHDVSAVWDLLAADPNDRWRLLTLDLPGFGASDKPVGHPYSIHAAADAVEAMWAATGAARTLLVAHDYSVSVAQELLARRADGTLPVTLDALVLMNGGLYPDLHRQTDGQQLLLSADGPRFAAAIDEELFAGAIEVTWGRRVPYDPALVADMWASMAESGGSAQMHALLHYVADRIENADRWRTALESTDLPLGFVWGDLDPVSGAHVMERVEPRFPHADITRLADVGHWPLLEAPDVVADAIRHTAHHTEGAAQ
jgi:pimeloyl-ACP methyl ester carboxylesterase